MFDSVTVFMSTYNGSNYLIEQIDSILNQRDVNITLVVRDDASTDNTLAILKDYKNKCNNIIVIEGKSAGVGKSFMSLLYNFAVNTDYFAFADQDDIWDDDKLITGITSLKSYDANIPRLYVCNQRCVDKNKDFLCNRFPLDFPVQKLGNLLFLNLYAGCTMVFNRALYNVLRNEGQRPEIGFFTTRVHDAWVACVASIYSPIVFDSTCHMSFRRHDTNVTDAEITRYGKIGLRTKLVILKRKLQRLHSRKIRKHVIELTAKELLRCHNNALHDNDKELLFMVCNYRCSLRNKLKLLTSGHLRKAAPERLFSLTIKTIFGVL